MSGIGVLLSVLFCDYDSVCEEFANNPFRGYGLVPFKLMGGPGTVSVVCRMQDLQ